MSDTELKPCPFCGGIPKIVAHSFDGWPDKFAVQCEYTGQEQGCGAEGQWSKIESLAVEAWNERTSERENNQLRADLKQIGIHIKDIKNLCEYRFRQDGLELARLCIENSDVILSLPSVQSALKDQPK